MSAIKPKISFSMNDGGAKYISGYSAQTHQELTTQPATLAKPIKSKIPPMLEHPWLSPPAPPETPTATTMAQPQLATELMPLSSNNPKPMSPLLHPPML